MNRNERRKWIRLERRRQARYSRAVRRGAREIARIIDRQILAGILRDPEGAFGGVRIVTS